METSRELLPHGHQASGPNWVAKVFLNGKDLFDAEDDTFKEAGKVRVWTKADSVTLFDDFSFGAR